MSNEFLMCSTCADVRPRIVARSGLCTSCMHNSLAIEHLSNQVRSLNKFCSDLKQKRTFYGLLRGQMRINSPHPTPYLVPQWVTVDDHDGRDHTTVDGAFTLPLCVLRADNYADAVREFRFEGLVVSGLQMLPFMGPGDSLVPKQSKLETAEQMVEFWAKEAMRIREEDRLK